MTKYNLSKIMKRAWELVKKAGLTISEGLKKAWREAKMNIEEMIRKYRIELSSDGIHLLAYEKEQLKRDNMMDTVKANKEEIISFLRDKKEAEEKAEKERREKINNIEGLREIEDAIKEQNKWTRDFNKMMDSENGAITIRARPENHISELMEKYPRAAAYIQAYNLSVKSNYELSEIGSEALEKIINGEDHESVINEMEQKRKEFSDRHIWD